MADQWEQWAKNIQSANGLDSGNIYQNYASAGVINAAPAQVTGKKATIQAGIDEKNRQEAARAKSIENQREVDKVDPGKARMIQNQDGTYSFYNGIGEKLNINQYAMLTGQKPSAILKDSDNPKDQRFVQDYDTMQAFVNAWVNGDNKTLQKMREADPDRFNAIVSTYKTPADLVAAFKNTYSDYYGGTTNQNDPSKMPAFSPQNLYGVGDDAQGKAMGQALAGSPLDQTLTPSYIQKPQQGEGFGGWLDSINPWGSYQNAMRAYQEQTKNNPWYAYNSYLGR
jgi:hypothetical protein